MLVQKEVFAWTSELGLSSLTTSITYLHYTLCMEVDPSDAPEASTSTSATSSIRITPLSGSQSTSRALCHLLEFDDAKILLDCGINPRREEFTYEDWTADRREYLERLKEWVSTLLADAGTQLIDGF